MYNAAALGRLKNIDWVVWRGREMKNITWSADFEKDSVSLELGQAISVLFNILKLTICTTYPQSICMPYCGIISVPRGPMFVAFVDNPCISFAFIKHLFSTYLIYTELATKEVTFPWIRKFLDAHEIEPRT